MTNREKELLVQILENVLEVFKDVQHEFKTLDREMSYADLNKTVKQVEEFKLLISMEK